MTPPPRKAPAPETLSHKPGKMALRRARRGMAVASIVASICGIAIGSRSGVGGAVIGAIAGVVAAGVAVFVVNAVLMLLSGILGRNPREIQNGIFALATWGVAALAALAAVGALIRLY